LKGEGDTNREDRLTTRLTGRILDVKPNGILVLEARARVQHDDEISEITLTGVCRKEDVTADNTVLSTQIANKEITVNNKGALRAAARRGWIPRLIDLIKPF
jgi:flagellar L-ring protein precursor FlgH